MAGIREIKHHLNKPDEVYQCELVTCAPEYLVLAYVTDRVFRFGPIEMPVGSKTIAHYREGVDYVIWEMFKPTGELAGYLIHFCRDLRLQPDSVSYLDLILDLWFYPDGRHLTLDREELEDAVALDKLDAEEAERLQSLARSLVERFPAFIAEYRRV